MEKIYFIHHIWDGGYGGEVSGAFLDKDQAQKALDLLPQCNKKDKHQSTWFALTEEPLYTSYEELIAVLRERGNI